MYQEQRLEKILELLEERKQLSAKEMVDYFEVSKILFAETLLSLANASWFVGPMVDSLPLNKEPGPSYLDRSQKANKGKDCYGSKGPGIDTR